MNVIIAGSRTVTNYDIAKAVKNSHFTVTAVICGDAKGVDTLGNKWAEENNIPVVHFPADWKTYGKVAGHVRNREMAVYSQALILIWDGISSGSKNMLKLANEYGLQIHIEIVK